MEKYAVGLVMLIIVVTYIIFMQYVKRQAKQLDDVDFNLSVASYKPNIRPGNCKVKLTALGADYQSTLATINRFTNFPLAGVVVDQVVVENISVYTAEDLVFELKYIGADAIVIDE